MKKLLSFLARNWATTLLGVGQLLVAIAHAGKGHLSVQELGSAIALIAARDPGCLAHLFAPRPTGGSGEPGTAS